ncbi:MAG: T9SS type A sorting domain-containing protein [Bacteroidia bacterium]|nr:T9SS type A sorting domain-containing protein [Bacteroidia bacterium]
MFAINWDGTLGTQIATNDNISATNLFSKITTGNLAAYGSFAVKIENNITNTSDNKSKGHYYLRIDACYDKSNIEIVGDNQVCTNTSKQFYVSNIPTNASVSWTSTISLVNISTNNNVATVSVSYNGIDTLVATISYCGETYIVKKTIGVGLPVFTWFDPPVNQAIEGGDFECNEGANAQCYSASPSGKEIWFTSNFINGNASWSKLWSIPASPGGSIIWSSAINGNRNEVNVHFKSANKHLTLKTTITNSCGIVEKVYCFYSTNESCPAQLLASCNLSLKIFPNPISPSNTLTLQLNIDGDSASFADATIQLISSQNNVIVSKIGNDTFTEQLQIPALSNGTYYINVTTSCGTVTEELIINGN